MKLWIARDFDGVLNLYVTKPSLDSIDNMYYVDSDMEDDYLNIDKELFPEVTFENSPQEVELKLVENLKMTQNKHGENIKYSIELLNLYKQCWEKIDFLTKIKSTYGDIRISDVIENLEYQAVKFKNKFENLITKE